MKIQFQQKLLLICVSDRHKIHQMCNKAADYSLVELKLSADWFVISKMNKKLLRLLT